MLRTLGRDGPAQILVSPQPMPPGTELVPYTTLFRSGQETHQRGDQQQVEGGDRARTHAGQGDDPEHGEHEDRKSTRLNSSHVASSYAVFCLKKKRAAA